MKFGTYILNSPNYISKKDLEAFSVWGEWYASEEVPYLKSLCESDEEFERVVIGPYEEGKETYYPVLVKNILPENEFLFVAVDVQILESTNAKGYISIVTDEIVALTIWHGKGSSDRDTTLYREDRLVADDENTKAIQELQNTFGIPEAPKLYISSEYMLSNGMKIEGLFKWCQT